MTTSGHDVAAVPDLLAEVIRRVVEVANPDRIILFGSELLLLSHEEAGTRFCLPR